MRDSLLIVKSAALDTAGATGTALDLGKGGSKGVLTFAIDVTAVQGTSPTLDLVLQFSDTSVFTVINEKVTLAQITAVGAFDENVQTPRRYVRYVSTIGGSSTPGLNYGIFIATSKRQITENVANA